METNALHQFFILFAWFPLAAFLLLLLLVARFYQRFSGEQMYFWLYLIPLVAFGLVSVRHAGAQDGRWDLIASLVSVLAGLILLFLVVRLYRHMRAHGEEAES
ncbi:hypothetical protein G4Y79_19560 [Phototrophicus methaneseepsis]|uniref:Uncharacterized protein n=1 Tax=Phototrophicus methaneseepsis TaxID=2710758 RepID=A0A7S8E7N7_9CHLR|nr:hypothetical protein [Phototrophicus methaneseepsis]QPC81864.1 hypothetical protein G4Y79_19560 [Phototrophicus methaneseepsis]